MTNTNTSAPGQGVEMALKQGPGSLARRPTPRFSRRPLALPFPRERRLKLAAAQGRPTVSHADASGVNGGRLLDGGLPPGALSPSLD